MQDCFRAHPDVYGAELSDDTEDLDDEMALDASQEPVAAPYSGASTAGASQSDANLTAPPSSSSQPTLGEGKKARSSGALAKTQSQGKPRSSGEKVADTKLGQTNEESESDTKARIERSKAAQRQVQQDHGEPTSESAEMVPKAWHDAK